MKTGMRHLFLMATSRSYRWSTWLRWVTRRTIRADRPLIASVEIPTDGSWIRLGDTRVRAVNDGHHIYMEVVSGGGAGGGGGAHANGATTSAR